MGYDKEFLVVRNRKNLSMRLHPKRKHVFSDEYYEHYCDVENMRIVCDKLNKILEDIKFEAAEDEVCSGD